MNYLASGKVPERIGNAHPNIVPYQVFTVADGYIIIATGNDSQYVKLCGVLGAPELAKDPSYIDNKARLANRAELVGKLTALTIKFKMQDLADQLEAVGVPAGPINNLDQVFDDPHVKHRGMKLNLPSAFAKVAYATEDEMIGEMRRRLLKHPSFRFAITPMFLFSGTFFPVTRLPQGLREVAYATPLWHGVDLIRKLSLGTATLGLSVLHVAYLAGWFVAGVILARRAYAGRLVT